MDWNRHPGPDYRYVICDICGRKYRVKDTVLVTDRYSKQNRMIVCKQSCLDTVNPQSYPYKLPKENFLTDRTYVRPELAEDVLAPNTTATTLPEAVSDLKVTQDPATSKLVLKWSTPNSSAMVTGYIITRANPQFAYHFIIENNTNSNVGYYLDLGSDPNSEYTYQVAAISAVGTGPYSNYGLWPYEGVYIPGTIYILVSQDNTALLTSDGKYFIL